MVKKTLGVATKNLIIAMNKTAQLWSLKKWNKIAKVERCRSIYVAKTENWISSAVHLHSVLEQIWIKGPYLDKRLPQHESLYP